MERKCEEKVEIRKNGVIVFTKSDCSKHLVVRIPIGVKMGG